MTPISPRPRPRLMPASLAALALLAAPAFAQTLAERAAAIEAQIAAGDTAGAQAAIRAFHRAASVAAGFHLSDPVLTTGPARGLGVYTPRASAVYAGGEPVLQYVEATGFEIERGEDGLNRIRLLVTFRVLDAAGTDISGPVEMGTIALDTRAEPAETFVDLTYTISGLTGPHRLETTVTDAIGGGSATFSQDVEFR